MTHEAHLGSHLHSHKRGDATTTHYQKTQPKRVLLIALLLTLLFAVVEVLAGFWSNSLALISDAGHMVTDSAAMGLALLAQFMARRPPSEKLSFGYGRTESLAAFVNALAMLALVVWIVIEALSRFNQPHPIEGDTVAVVAFIGLVVNLIVAWTLSHDHENLNTKAALIHVMGDLLGSVAAIVSGLVVSYTGWLAIDPLLSIFVSLLVLRSTFDVLKRSYHFLMEGVPHHISYTQVGKDLHTIDGVLAVHDLHIWEMAHGEAALIGHVEVENLSDWPKTLDKIHEVLRNKYSIDHVTLQPELPS